MMLYDYTSVTAETMGRDLTETLDRAEEIVAAVVSEPSPRSFANTMQPLADMSDLLGDLYGRGAFLGQASADPAIRDMARNVEERLSKWQVELIFREDLYEAVKSYADTAEAADLDGEHRRLLNFTLRDLVMAGHELSTAAREELRTINARLVELSIQFQTNLADYRDYLVVTRSDLAGLPEDYIDQLEVGEKKDTFCVSMEYPDVIPFLDHAQRRDLREALSQKFNSRAAKENRPLLDETVRLRSRSAEIFGLPSWADYRMQEKMAEGPAAVSAFYADLIPPLTALARQEVERIADLLEEDTGDRQVQLWDWRYYDQQLLRTEYGIDQLEVAKYFSLDRVVAGMLDLTAEVFGLRYVEVPDPRAWHADAVLYEIRDAASDQLLAHFYMDLFPREGKFGHAAAFPLVQGRHSVDGYVRPVTAVLANFTKPTGDKPSLLMHNEVVTLFHEFGHVLHMSLTKAHFGRFSGAGTEGDFVEAPSQIMEHWCWRPEILARFGHHYETGEPIPAALIEEMARVQNLNVAIKTLRQVSFGVFDMAIHGPGPFASLEEAARASTEVTPFPHQPRTFFPASFGHMYGYDAGYYGYLWAEVFGDDMFSVFEKEGLANAEVGARYRREVLEPNGIRDAAELLRAFLGREPSNAAFLRKLGIEAQTPAG